MAPSRLLLISIFLNIKSLQIYGDSKIIIDHVNSKHSIKNHRLSGWMNRIDSLWKTIKDYAVNHVVRSHNTQVDELSEKGLQSQVGKWEMIITVGDIKHQIQYFALLGT